MRITPPIDDAVLLAHRHKIQFYYDRANPLESAAADALCFVKITLTIALDHPRGNIPDVVTTTLERLTNLLEQQYCEARQHIIDGPAYRSLTDGQRTAMDTGCFNIEVHAFAPFD